MYFQVNDEMPVLIDKIPTSKYIQIKGKSNSFFIEEFLETVTNGYFQFVCLYFNAEYDSS